ncbi:hypothetical protein HK101_006575 [Irineochytrium annulatum]|nr:hypothetical protein HK101_006575 [Irineochytrium annulatum]
MPLTPAPTASALTPRGGRYAAATSTNPERPECDDGARTVHVYRPLSGAPSIAFTAVYKPVGEGTVNASAAANEPISGGVMTIAYGNAPVEVGRAVNGDPAMATVPVYRPISGGPVIASDAATGAAGDYVYRPVL